MANVNDLKRESYGESSGEIGEQVIIIEGGGGGGGNADTATTATHLAGGSGGTIPYQSASGTTVQLANGTAGQVLTSAGTTLAPTWSTVSGLSWNSSITGTTGTGVLLTMGNSYAASGIGQSIVLGNTQTNSLTALNINTGTSAVTHIGLRIKGLMSNPNSAGTDNSGLININGYASATQAVGHISLMSIGRNFNTNSSFASRGIAILNEQNAGTRTNTGIYIENNSTDFVVPDQGVAGIIDGGAGIAIYQFGTGGVALSIGTKSNVNSSTNGIVNYTLSNTQSGASVMQKIDLGTSAQGHTGLLIASSGASATQKAIDITLANSGGIGINSSVGGAGWNNKFINLSHSVNGTLGGVNRTSTDFFLESNFTNTQTSGTKADNFDVAQIKRTSVQNGAGGTFTSTGSVLKLENVATQTAGTLTDTVAVLSLLQSNNSVGGHIHFNAYSGTPTPNNTFWYDGTNFKYIDNAGTTKTITAT